MTDTTAINAFPKGGDRVQKTGTDLVNSRTFANFTKSFAEDFGLDSDQASYYQELMSNEQRLSDAINDYDQNIFGGSSSSSSSSSSSAISGGQGA